MDGLAKNLELMSLGTRLLEQVRRTSLPRKEENLAGRQHRAHFDCRLDSGVQADFFRGFRCVPYGRAK
jgi:hypothetical protein